MEMLGITEHGEKKVKNLSGGTKRKLAYALTLFGNPEITLLDGILNIFCFEKSIFLKIFQLRAIDRT